MFENMGPETGSIRDNKTSYFSENKRINFSIKL